MLFMLMLSKLRAAVGTPFFVP